MTLTITARSPAGPSVHQPARASTPGAPPSAAQSRRSFAELLALAARSGDVGAALGLLARGVAAPGRSAPSSPVRSVPAAYQSVVAEAAERYRLDPALLAGLIETESGFNPRAVSPAGAKGLMQLMDATARGLGVTDPFDPRQNVLGGARFLRQLLDRYGGDVPRALAAYNAGPAAVDRYGGLPPYAETQRFVPKVLAAADRYRQSSGPRSGPGSS